MKLERGGVGAVAPSAAEHCGTHRLRQRLGSLPAAVPTTGGRLAPGRGPYRTVLPLRFSQDSASL